MSDCHETLEDVLSYLEGARDTLLTIYNAIEDERSPKQITLSALYGVYNHLDLIIGRMAKHIEGLSYDALEAAAEKAH